MGQADLPDRGGRLALLEPERARRQPQLPSSECDRARGDQDDLLAAPMQAQQILADAAKKAERDIDAATKRALDDIRREVADLTVLATEKVVRKTLNEADQRRLVEEALNEIDLSSLSSGAQSN